MYMDDIRLFAKDEKELETLIHAVRIYNQEIGMEFSIEKCAIIIWKAVNDTCRNQWNHQNREKIRMLGEKETYKYLGILKANTIKQVEKKEIFLKRIPLEKAPQNQAI